MLNGKVAPLRFQRVEDNAFHLHTLRNFQNLLYFFRERMREITFTQPLARVTIRGIRHVKVNAYRFHAPVVAVCVARRELK
jgi:hypothetical protein